MRRRRAACPSARRQAGGACSRAADWRRSPLVGPASTILPLVITQTRSAILRTMPRSWVMNSIDMPLLVLEPGEQFEDLRLHGHVERRGRLVGDQQLRLVGERHGDHHALALAAGKLVRIGAEPLFRLADADLVEQLERPRARLPARPCPGAATAPRTICCSIVCSGLSEVIGSWKIMVILLPRTWRSSFSPLARRSLPWNRISPDGWLAGG